MSKGNSKIKYDGIDAVDLFCGGGGLTCGLRQTGIDVRMGGDFDGRCEYAYEHNNDFCQNRFWDAKSLLNNDRFIIVDQKEIFWKMRRRNAHAFRRGDSAKAEPEGRTSVRGASLKDAGPPHLRRGEDGRGEHPWTSRINPQGDIRTSRIR